MSVNFIENTIQLFEALAEVARKRRIGEASECELFLANTTHCIQESDCMDGRIPESVLPYNAGRYVTLAGGIPNTGEANLLRIQNTIKTSAENGRGFLILPGIHTECAAFEKNDAVATAAGLKFLQNIKLAFPGDTVQGFLRRYNVVTGAIDILRPDTLEWFGLEDFALPDGGINGNARFLRGAKALKLSDELVHDLALLASCYRRKRQSPGSVVQRHSERTIVCGSNIRPWRVGSDFLTYRTDLLSNAEHIANIKRAAEVVDHSLADRGNRTSPILLFQVFSHEELEYSATIATDLEAFAHKHVTVRKVQVIPYVLQRSGVIQQFEETTRVAVQ